MKRKKNGIQYMRMRMKRKKKYDVITVNRRKGIVAIKIRNLLCNKILTGILYFEVL